MSIDCNKKRGGWQRTAFTKSMGAVLLCLLSVTATQAAAKSISVTRSSVEGNYTLSWSGFMGSVTLVENNKSIYQGSGRSLSISNKAPGTYVYLAIGCAGSMGYNCGPASPLTVVVSASTPEPEQEEPLEFSRSEIEDFLDNARSDGKQLIHLVGDEVESRLRAANISLDRSGLTYTASIPNQQLRGGCSANVKSRGWRVSAHISSESDFDVVFEALSKPIVAKLELIGYVDASGKVTTRFGARLLGSCIQYARTTISLDANVDFKIDTSLVIRLNPVKDTSQPGVLKIGFDPQVQLAGGIRTRHNLDISLTSGGFLKKIPVAGDVVYGVMVPLLEDLTEHYAGKELDQLAGSANSRFARFLSAEEVRLQNKLREEIPREYVLPISPEHENEMLSFVSHYALDYLPPSSFLRAHGADIIYNLLIGDVEAVKNEIATAAACNASADAFSLNLPTTARPSGFKTTSRSEFCGKVGNKAWLGNAEPGVSGYNGQEAWTLMPSTRFDLSTVASIENNYQPYTKRVRYRTVGVTNGLRMIVDYESYAQAWQDCYSAGRGYCGSGPRIEDHATFVPAPRGSGSCKLEMRIYKKNVSQTGLKPMMAIHGGAWKYRGAAFYGLENQISHFTEQGFVVFAPFYRLAGESDGNTECNNATGEEIQDDIEAALTWVKNNKTTYGAQGNARVTLFGQSAGAHLSAWLVTHKPSDIEKALLMYPPTDAEDYITEFQAFTNGAYYSPDYEGSFEGLGVDALQGYFASINSATNTREENPLENIDVNSNAVQENSFPGIVAGSPSYYPPVFMIHGKVDRLVPSIQSVRLCNAYAGNPSSGPASNSGTATRQVYTCGQSRLHLLQEANHMLELCLPPLRCEAGESSASITAARQSLTEARNWLAQ